MQQFIAQGQCAAIPLHLEGAVEHTATWSPKCPSAGSAGHWLGLCTPCDFFHRHRCTKEDACKFCHLCGPGESRRRKRQNRALKQAATHLQAASVSPAVGGVSWA